MIRETKPRKAKYAFEIQMSVDMMDYAPALAAMSAALAAVPTRDKESAASYWTEYKNGMGTYVLTIYVNDPHLAAKLRKAAAVRQEVQPEEPKAAIVTEHKVGEAVTILNPGNTFDTYHAWPEIDCVPNFQYGDAPPRGYSGKITHIGRHEYYEPGNLDWVLYVVDGRFIVGSRAFKEA